MKKKTGLFIAGIVLLSLIGGAVVLMLTPSTEATLFKLIRAGQYPQAILMLNDNRVNVNARDRWGYTLLHRSHSPELTALLLEKGSNPALSGAGKEYIPSPINSVLDLRDSVLHSLWQQGFGQQEALEAAQGIQTRLTDIRKTGEDLTPLHTVEEPQVLELLLEHGAHVNAQSRYGETPLHTASSREKALLLITAGAEINARSLYGETPLLKAVSRASLSGDFSVVNALLNAGADPDMANNMGITPLHSVRSHVKLARLLLSFGADSDLADNNGDRPICFAIADNELPVIRALIVTGKGILTRCSQDRTLLTYAENKATADTVKALESMTKLILKAFSQSKRS